MQKRFTGWHMAGILVAFFGVVAAVNFLMARYAISTFDGVVVENSYVASQKYNEWLAEAREGEALGWDAELTREADGRVKVTLSGAPENAEVMGLARRPLGEQGETALKFSRKASGSYLSEQALASGRWVVRLEVRAEGERWRTEAPLP